MAIRHPAASQNSVVLSTLVEFCLQETALKGNLYGNQQVVESHKERSSKNKHRSEKRAVRPFEVGWIAD